MRWIVAIALALALASPGFAQVAAEKNKFVNYYPLKTGAKWTYEVDDGTGQKARVVNHLAGMETVDGKELARMETTVGGTVAATEHLSGSPAGVFRHRYKGDSINPALCILKYPFKEADSWEAEATVGSQRLKMKVKTGRNEEIRVPAGKYKTVTVLIETTVDGESIAGATWYAADVGVVKQITDVGAKRITLELLKFEPGK